jgi:hypothetical protein
MHRWLLAGVIMAGAGTAWDRIEPGPGMGIHAAAADVSSSHWELRKVGEGQRCVVALGPATPAGAVPAEFDNGCVEIDGGLAGQMTVVADNDRMVFVAADGATVMEFVAGDGDVYEATGASRAIVTLARLP